MTQTNNKTLTAFERLCEIDCGGHTEKKNGLTYLSWVWAWKEFKKAHPDAKYEITHWDGKPYLFDESLGYMVETSITAGGETHSMWLPVMNNANKAMKSQPYEIKTSTGKTIVVEAATMFDINTAIMRCLVKNIAMFGLGLYIYAGEDLPELSETTLAEKREAEQAAKMARMKEKIKLMLDSLDPAVDTSKYKDYNNIDDIGQLTSIGIELKKMLGGAQ